MSDLQVLHHASKSESCRQLQAATNRRLRSRGLGSMCVKENGVLTIDTLRAVRKAAWALGALKSTYDEITETRAVAVGVQRMIRNPGKRNAAQMQRGKVRVSQMRADRKRREQQAKTAGTKRKRAVQCAMHAAANYRHNAGSYHYLAGGIANLIYLQPSPHNYRSDCSQFVASVYKDAGLPSPANVPHQWASTYSIVKCPSARITTNPKPGDLGMYGARSGPLASRYTHHVEMYCGEPGAEFVGHGSPPIDSLTPGRPDFYVTFDFLDD